MFKIQKLLNRSRHFFNKIQIPRTIPKNESTKYQLSSFLSSHTNFSFSLSTTCMFSMSLLSLNQLKFDTQNSTKSEVEETPVGVGKKSEVKALMARITTEMREEIFDVARTYIDEAIAISEQNNFSEFLPQLYDSLVVITLREGNNELVEEILVRSIEKLIEIGYKEADNEIVRFQLILARLYQAKGDSTMAGLGFRNCVRIQETKLNADGEMGEVTSALYLSSLFWYGAFLSDQDELFDARNYMEKALKLSKSTSNDPARNIVILHNLAELCFRSKDFDDSIKYLVDGLRLCLQNLSIDSALPVFMVKLGLVYLVKGMCEAAGYWCSIAQVFARSSNNACVENEATLCLKYLREGKTKDK